MNIRDSNTLMLQNQFKAVGGLAWAFSWALQYLASSTQHCYGCWNYDELCYIIEPTPSKNDDTKKENPSRHQVVKVDIN